MLDELTVEQKFELQKAELCLKNASREQLIELYLGVLGLYFRYQNHVKTMFSEKLQGERSGRSV